MAFEALRIKPLEKEVISPVSSVYLGEQIVALTKDRHEDTAWRTRLRMRAHQSGQLPLGSNYKVESLKEGTNIEITPFHQNLLMIHLNGVREGMLAFK